MLSQEKSLGHEKNAGASCKKCGPKCEGLDLHFWRKICNNCKCKLEEHEVVMPAAHVPKKFVKKKIIVDDGGKPNFPDKTIPTSDDVTSTAESKEDDALPPPPLDIDSLNDYVQSLSIGPVTVTIPATSAADPGAPVAVDGTHEHDSASVQPIAENIRNSFTFVPDGANEETVSKYLASIPTDKAPINEEGSQYHTQQMIQQLPAHDFEESMVDELTEEEREKMINFKKKRDEEDSGQGVIREQTETVADPGNCTKCDKNFTSGGVVIFAKLLGPEKCWHPECFVCETCQEILVDLIYFHHEENIYCGRHYGEILGIRCAACDELIFSESYAQAEDQNYHARHFCCFECDKELAGQQYVPKDGHPYCMNCNETKFSKVCHGCGNNIPTNEASYSYEEFFWHNDAACFSCCVCKTSLIGREFVPKDGSIYCSSACFAKVMV